MLRVVVYYSGRVQGVGFRFTAKHIARSYSVTGRVRNLPDGRVELIAEGDPAEIDRYLAELAKTMGGNIRDSQRSEQPGTGEFAEFVIGK